MEGSGVAGDRSYAWRLLVAMGVLVLFAVGCSDGTQQDAEASAGLDACDEQPNECNSGPRDQGGEITWLVDQGHGGVYNHHRPEGGTVYLLQMLQGLLPGNEGLLGYFTPDGQWEWDRDLLAADPEVTSEDPLTIVFEIRDEAVWSDGTPIDVEDMRWNWYHNSGDEAHCVGCEPRGTAGWENLESIEGSDDGKTITVTYQDGVQDPEWFARFGFSYPAHVSGADWSTPEGMGESSQYFLEEAPDWSGGPYVVEEWVPDQRQVLVPNPEWYGEVEPSLDRVIKEVIPDQGAWLPALDNGEIDGGSPSGFFPDLLDELEQRPEISASVGSGGASWEHVDVNMDSLTDPALRQAIFTAIDVEDARQRIHGELEPPLRTNHIFSQASPHHADELTSTGYGSGDPGAARDILEEAGYDGAEEGATLSLDGEPVPDLRFVYGAGNEERAVFVELVQSYLADIGLTVAPQAVPGNELAGVLVGQEFELAVFGWGGSPVFTQVPQQLYTTESGTNFGRLSNAQLDELAVEMQNQPDVEASAEIANEIVEILMEEAYSLPLWDSPDMMFVTDDYVNIRDNHQSGLRSLYNIEEWGLAGE